MEEAPLKCASFLTQSNALRRKNISIQKRNIRENVLLVMFPDLVCLMFFGIQKRMNKFQAEIDKRAAMKFPANNASAILHPLRHPGLLQVPKSKFCATQANNTADPNYHPDLPRHTCRAEGSCLVSILLTGMNRFLAESLVQNFYGIESLNETSDSVDASQSHQSLSLDHIYTTPSMMSHIYILFNKSALPILHSVSPSRPMWMISS